MSFTIFQNEKTTFQPLNKRSSNGRKIEIFAKGLTHGFDQNMEVFSTFFFLGNIGQENVFCDILEQKNSIVDYKNKGFTPLKNCHFSKGVNPRFWSKNGYFSKFFFQAIQAKKMSFTIFQNEKTSFQAIKTTSSNNRKIDIFLKWLTHGFWSKNSHFFNYFLDNIGQENVFYDIRERKNGFLG